MPNFRFSCQLCHRCCRHTPGFVFVTQEDVEQLMLHFGLSEENFVTKYLRRVYREGKLCYSLREKENFDCIFWQQGCSVYEVRPLQCRSYPFWQRIVADEQTWQNEKEHCPGIDQGRKYSVGEVKSIAKRLLQASPFTPSDPV